MTAPELSARADRVKQIAEMLHGKVLDQTGNTMRVDIPADLSGRGPVLSGLSASLTANSYSASILGAAMMPDKILVEIIGEHLPYEIDMLLRTYRELQARANKPAQSQEERTVRNALVEAFCIHARSLLDFFADKRSDRTDDTDAIASDFATGFVTALKPAKEPLKSLRNKLNKQIFHLTKVRTITDAKKFDVGVDGVCLLKFIEPEIEKFTTALALKPEFKSFKCETSPMTVFAGLPFSASTAIAAQTTTIEFGHHPPKPDQE